MSRSNNLKVALTGGIGSGKTFVCRRIKALLGVDVYDCDEAAKRLMRTDENIIRRLTEIIGPHTYVDGQLNKAAVAQFLLLSEENTTLINNVVHPAVAEDFLTSGLRWMECAILYESGFDRWVDRVICVTAPIETRIRRIMARDGLDSTKAQEWIAKQMPQEIVRVRADFEIINDGLHDIDTQIVSIMNRLRNEQMV